MADNTSNKKKRCQREEQVFSSEESYLHVNDDEAKRLKVDMLLDILDGDDDRPDQASADVAAVMSSLQEEISGLRSQGSGCSTCQMPDDLWYLLEASDDDLGLPPPPETSASSTVTLDEQIPAGVETDDGGFGQVWVWEDQIYGDGGLEESVHGTFDCVPDSLYDDRSDFHEFLWRSESLPVIPSDKGDSLLCVSRGFAFVQ